MSRAVLLLYAEGFFLAANVNQTEMERKWRCAVRVIFKPECRWSKSIVTFLDLGNTSVCTSGRD